MFRAKLFFIRLLPLLATVDAVVQCQSVGGFHVADWLKYCVWLCGFPFTESELSRV